ncbi:MAG: ribonuclease HI [bacterium]
MIQIFTDGSARGNPGPGGWGAIVATDDMVIELGGREEHTTNNRMELLAVISALESIPHEHEMSIYTDSAYVLNGSTRWVVGWQKNNWKTSQKEDVLNRDLWERMVFATDHKIIDWHLLKGHTGHAPNERCDVIATTFADNKPIVLYHGARERYGVSLNVHGNNPLSPKAPTRQKRAYSYVSEVGGVIQTHKTWEECKARVHGKPARFKKAVSPSDEEEIIKEFS